MQCRKNKHLFELTRKKWGVFDDEFLAHHPNSN